MKVARLLPLLLAFAATFAAASDLMQLGIAQVQGRDFQGAVKSLSSLLQAQPGNANALLYRGYAHYYLGELDAAKQDFVQAIKLAPNVSQGHFNHGLVLDEQGQHEQAIEQYQKAMRLAPTDASVYYNMGNSYSKLGKNHEAARSFEEALKLNPHHAGASHNLSMVKARLASKR